MEGQKLTQMLAANAMQMQCKHIKGAVALPCYNRKWIIKVFDHQASISRHVYIKINLAQVHFNCIQRLHCRIKVTPS